MRGGACLPVVLVVDGRHEVGDGAVAAVVTRRRPRVPVARLPAAPPLAVPPVPPLPAPPLVPPAAALPPPVVPAPVSAPRRRLDDLRRHADHVDRQQRPLLLLLPAPAATLLASSLLRPPPLVPARRRHRQHGRSGGGGAGAGVTAELRVAGLVLEVGHSNAQQLVGDEAVRGDVRLLTRRTDVLVCAQQRLAHT